MFHKILFIFFVSFVCVNLQDFGFPEMVEDSKNANNRTPLLIPAKCQENELLYPGDQKDDWICDCGPAQIYYPLTDRCYPIYRQGPCAVGEYLVLKAGNAIPECIKNPCGENELKYNNKCYAWEDRAPCPLKALGSSVGVNETTLDIQCLIPAIGNRYGESDTYCIGSRRAYQGRCPTQ